MESVIKKTKYRNKPHSHKISFVPYNMKTYELHDIPIKGVPAADLLIKNLTNNLRRSRNSIKHNNIYESVEANYNNNKNEEIEENIIKEEGIYYEQNSNEKVIIEKNNEPEFNPYSSSYINNNLEKKMDNMESEINKNSHLIKSNQKEMSKHMNEISSKINQISLNLNQIESKLNSKNFPTTKNSYITYHGYQPHDSPRDSKIIRTSKITSNKIIHNPTEINGIQTNKEHKPHIINYSDGLFDNYKPQFIRSNNINVHSKINADPSEKVNYSNHDSKHLSDIELCEMFLIEHGLDIFKIRKTLNKHGIPNKEQQDGKSPHHTGC